MNAALFDAWKAFTKTTLSVLKDGVRTGTWRVTYSGRPTFKDYDDGRFETSLVPEPDISAFVHGSRNEVSKTPQYRILCEQMDADPKVARHIGKPVMTIQGGGTYHHWDYAVLPVLAQIGKATVNFGFDQAILDRSLSELDRFFSCDTVTLTYIAPLYNFGAQIDHDIILQDNIRIRPTTEEELRNLIEYHSSYGAWPFFKVPRLKFTVEIKVESPVVFGDTPPRQPSDSSSTFDMVVSALRLFKTGNVTIDIVRTVPTLKVPLLHEGATLRESYIPTGRWYSLSTDEAESFRTFWSEFRDADLSKPGSPGVAMRRFNFAYGRGLLEDKALDLVIAFEALFLKEGEFSNVHKLAIRAARLLGKTFEERRVIFHEVQDFYGKRSSMIHGASTTLSEEMVFGIEERLRSSFKAMLTMLRTKSHSEILEHLDLE